MTNQRIVNVKVFTPINEVHTEWWEIHNRKRFLWIFHRWVPLMEYDSNGDVQHNKKFSSLEEALKHSDAGKINIGVCSTVVWEAPEEI